MTKLRWEKSGQYEPDPGALVEVPESTRPSGWVPPQERARKEAERAERRRELLKRSEQRDRELSEARLEASISRKKALGIPLMWLEKMFLKQREERC